MKRPRNFCICGHENDGGTLCRYCGGSVGHYEDSNNEPHHLEPKDRMSLRGGILYLLILILIVSAFICAVRFL